jgi:hypothetical protein
MKFFVSILLTALLSFAFGLYLPWWSLAIAAFVVAALIPLHPGLSFASGFLALLLLWGIMAWMISTGNDHILAHRMSQVILKKDAPGRLVMATSLIGALVGGFGALSGRLFRLLWARA